MERKLAAILAADMVGYSRLMERDEVRTLAVPKLRPRNVLDPLVAKHQGRVFKAAGDGVLVSPSRCRAFGVCENSRCRA
jgi:adenylate cyclase